jgi:hypothetical protein
MIVKIFETYVSLGNLHPSPKKTSLLSKEVIFFMKELFLFYGELAWD